MATYTMHIALEAESDAEALAVADALRAVVGELHLTDAEDWAEHVGAKCAWAGEAASAQVLRDGPRIQIDVPVCGPELVSIGVGRRVCVAHARAYAEAQAACRGLS